MSHRKKQEQLMKDLKEYNWNLQREVWSLEFRRNETLLSIPTEQTVWTIALEYFRIFRYGLNDTMETNYPYIWKFLSTAMTTDVTYESVCGHEAILNYWRLFSHYFDDIFVELECLTKGNEANTLLATTIMSVTISKNTLRRVFPHLIREERSRLGLAAKLIDQQVVMRRLVLFKWNDKLKCVERIQSQADMLTPLLQIVGSLESVSHVFENALVTAECKLIPEISGDSRYWMQLMR
ncbi:hypothetical protein PHMEG_00014805 [Phytophthora megakarya]|uniref:Bzip transcription factor n=1 Tax=Phytophthora megakarya TaxID=4795 RepID=A0A225W4F6_9STRA|nr:hypothetical protein PHMEG_00014805 [Phytophthora megakarya]